MTNFEQLQAMLRRSGWEPTTEADEDGSIVCKSSDEAENN